MAEEITINDLEDFSSDSSKISMGSLTYGILLRKIGNSYAAYKFNVNLLESFFLLKTEIESHKTTIQQIYSWLERKLATFFGAEYMEDAGYMLKNDADIERKDLPTEQTLLAALEKYMTPNDLKVCVQQAKAYASQCASSYSATMADLGASLKSSRAQANYTQITAGLNALASSLNRTKSSEEEEEKPKE